MYYAINRLDAEKFARLDFTINFGIEQVNRRLMTDCLTSGGGYKQTCEDVFEKIPTF